MHEEKREYQYQKAYDRAPAPTERCALGGQSVGFLDENNDSRQKLT